MAKNQQISDNLLRYGDLVTLRSTRWSSYLSSDGTLNDDVFVSDQMDSFEDHLFQLTIQRQYSAKNEYEDFLLRRHQLMASGEAVAADDSSRKHFDALTTGKTNEIIMNDQLMKHRMGTPVKFGDVIQLLHLKSKKFLYVPGKDLARDERENMLLSLSVDGGLNSWIQLLPRFKINKEGDNVANNAECILRLSERGAEHFHCSEKKPSGVSRFREVNISMETQSSFRLSIYYSTQFPVSPATLLLGELVYIRDPEVGSNLQTFQKPSLASRRAKADADDDSVIASLDSAAKKEREDAGSEAGSVAEGSDKDNEDEEISVTSAEEFEHEYGTVTLKPSGESLNSNCVWVMESQAIIQGGALLWRSDQVYFRHLNTGAYLTTYDPTKASLGGGGAEEEEVAVEEGGEPLDSCCLTTSKLPSSKWSLFTINALHSSGENLESSGAIQLRQGDIFLERNPVYNDRWQTYPCSGTRNKLKAVGLIINKYSEELSEVGNSKNAKFRLQPGALDIHYCLSITYTLKRFHDHMKIPGPRDAKQTSVWPTLDDLERAYFRESVSKIIIFIKGVPIMLNSLDRNDYRINPQVIRRRQDMFNEQGGLEYVLNMLSYLIPISDRMTTKDAVPQQFLEGGLLRLSSPIISDCLRILYEATTGNKSNQMIVAEYMPVILSHCGTDPLAAKITQELLATNRELQETKITAKDINTFSEKIKESEMTSMFLRLLQSCCTSLSATTGELEGVSRNQANVLHILFGTHKDALIKISTDNSEVRLVTWVGSESSTLYVPSSVVEQNVLGSSIFVSGIPSTLVTWTSKLVDFDPQTLTGKPVLKVKDLFSEDVYLDSTTDSSSSSKRGGSVLGTLQRQASMAFARSVDKSRGTSSHKNLKQVGEFLVAQLYLASSLCVGRNYLAMMTLQDDYPYTLLITLMKDSRSPSTLQGAAASLLTNLYIDRDPQLAVTLPRLTRTWTEISNPDSASIFSVGSERTNMFMLPQLLIANHLRSLKGVQFTSATTSMLLMLRKLVAYGFYGDRDKLNDLIVPLMEALNRKEVGEAGAGEQTQSTDELSVSVASSLSIKSKQKAVLNRRMAAYKVSVNAEEEDLGDGNEAGGDLEMTSLLKGQSGQVESDGSIKTRWQENVLLMLESMTAMCLMLVVVLLAVAEAVWSYIDGYVEGMDVFEYVVFAFFAADVAMRAYCHKVVRNHLHTFFMDIFNIFDTAVVVLDVAIFIQEAVTTDATSNNGSNLAKTLRIVRVLRVLRAARFLKVIFVYRAMQLVNAAAQLVSGNELITLKWTEPERFSNTSDANIRNLIEMCTVLECIQKLVEDRNMSLLLRGFLSWNNDLNLLGQGKDEDKEKLESSAGSLMLSLEREFENLQVSSPEWDDVYIDLLMYSNQELVQKSLNILLAHHCNKRSMVENCSRIQLLVNQRREAQYQRVESLIKVINGHIETFDIWCSLKKEDNRKVNMVVHDALNEMAQMCTRRREVLKFDEELEPDSMIQDILRNLGAHKVCMQVMRLLSTIDVNNTISVQHTNTRQLVLEASRLVYWMILDNSKGQTLAYGSLDFFIKILDEKVESHRIIAAIFRDNEYLAKNVPKKYIGDFVDMIINQGRFPQYLTFLNAIAVVGDKNMIENQYEIIRLISAPYNQKKCVMYFVPASHPTYAKKIKDMALFQGKKDLVPYDLSSDLAYHLDLIQLLSRCTMGTDGMTTIEAKVQSMYSFVDVIDSMLDSSCLLGAKVRYGQFVYNALLEVEMKLPSLKDSKAIWDLIESFQDVVAFAKDEIRQIEKNGWSAPTSTRQKIEYMLVGANIVYGYFKFYFDYSIFQPEVGQIQGIERVQIREKRAWEIVHSLFYKFKAVYEMQTPLMSKEHQVSLYNVLALLNTIPPAKIVMNVENMHNGYVEVASSGSPQERALKVFVDRLTADEAVQDATQAETLSFIDKVEQLPRMTAIDPDAHVRYEALIEKLVTHIRSTIKVVNYGGEVTKYIDHQATRTNTWLIRNFRLMIEKRWGMTIFERDEDGGEEQDEAAADIMETLNNAGATEACLELIARGINPDLQAEAIKLIVAMLFKEGGAHAVQASINACLSRRGSDLFFLHIRSMLQGLISWHKWHGIVVLEDGQDPDLPPEIILVRMLQLMCEGHYKPNQDVLREQPNNTTSVNLLDDFVAYLITLDAFPCRTSTEAALAVTATVLEVIQGPCENNQDHFALSSELLETINRKLRQRPVHDCDPEAEFELKKTLVDILQGLLEGQGRRVAIYERVLSVIHLDVVKHMISSEPEEDSDAASELQTECLVLLRLLLDFKPELTEELEISEDELSSGTNVVSIEVVWRGELQRRFFPVPEICSDLAKATKDEFIISADRSSSEGKLYSLVAAGRAMYKEILHQQLLKSWGLASIFSRGNLGYVSWFSLALVCIINSLYISYYQNVVVDCVPSDDAGGIYKTGAPTSVPTSYPTSVPTSKPTSAPTAGGTPYDAGGGDDDGGPPPVACLKAVLFSSVDGTDIGQVALGLGILLVISASYCVINCLVVRIPVVFSSEMVRCGVLYKAVLNSALDGVTMYHTGYLVLAIASLWDENHHIAALLLLDIISKSKTTQDTLMALYMPRVTILLAMLLTFLFCYIFAVFAVSLPQNSWRYSQSGGWVCGQLRGSHVAAIFLRELIILTSLFFSLNLHPIVLLYPGQLGPMEPQQSQQRDRRRVAQLEKRSEHGDSSQRLYAGAALGLAVWLSYQNGDATSRSVLVPLVLGLHLFHDVLYYVEYYQGYHH